MSASSGRFSTDTAQQRDIANQMQDITHSVRQISNHLHSEAQALSMRWKGMAGFTFQQKASELNDALAQLTQTQDLINEKVQTAAGHYESSDSTGQSQITAMSFN